MRRGCFISAFTISIPVCATSAAAAPTYHLTTLATFNGKNGGGPYGGLIADASGNLYGTTYYGGANDAGTVFELAAGTHTLSTLATFNVTNGQGPNASLIADASGNLYGTTGFGGANNAGTVFKLAASTHALSTLATFNGTNGAVPYFASLIADTSGNLYGTTFEGGANDRGTVFELAAGSNTITTLATFNGANGQYPAGFLLADSSGNLYGTTFYGGANGLGTVFKIANDVNHTLSTLATFNGSNGANPYAGLIADVSGNLYGTTEQGGVNNQGIVFELAAGTHALSTLGSFNGANGAYPWAGLLADANGNMYGTTYGGGSSDNGTVFEVAAGTHAISTLINFNGPNGSQPYASLIADASGNLYSTTWQGGANGRGTVFELSPVPEPSTFVLAAVGTFSFSAGRARAKSTRLPNVRVSRIF